MSLSVRPLIVALAALSLAGCSSFPSMTVSGLLNGQGGEYVESEQVDGGDNAQAEHEETIAYLQSLADRKNPDQFGAFVSSRKELEQLRDDQQKEAAEN